MRRYAEKYINFINPQLIIVAIEMISITCNLNAFLLLITEYFLNKYILCNS